MHSIINPWERDLSTILQASNNPEVISDAFVLEQSIGIVNYLTKQDVTFEPINPAIRNYNKENYSKILSDWLALSISLIQGMSEPEVQAASLYLTDKNLSLLINKLTYSRQADASK